MTESTVSDPRVSVVDLSGSVEAGTKGETVAVVLPSGTVLDLWVYEAADTCSVDVRVRRTLDDVNGVKAWSEPVARTFMIGGTAVVVVR